MNMQKLLKLCLASVIYVLTSNVALAQCQNCGHYPGSSHYECYTTSEGWTLCGSSVWTCTLGGYECAIARLGPDGNRVKTRTECESITAKLLAKTAIQLASIDSKFQASSPLSPTGFTQDAEPDIATALENRFYADLKSNALPKGPASDHLELFRLQSRDEIWAGPTEKSISSQLKNISISEFGLSAPVVKCKTSVCEIIITQDMDMSDDKNKSWQKQFIRLRKSGSVAIDAYDTSIMMTTLTPDLTGYITLLVFDR